jgi:rare lipoprotein A (peptidoglycan hydrolase)
VVPLLLIQNEPDASASPSSGSHAGRHAAQGGSHVGAPPWMLASDTTHRSASGGSSPTTSTTAPATLPATVPPTTTTTTTAPPVAVPVTAQPPPTTTTTTAVATAQLLGSEQTGQVTYYAHPAGTCASPWLAFGTVVRITNPANDESVTCVVNDREADTERSIDLATATFAEIAPLSQGVIDAELSW